MRFGPVPLAEAEGAILAHSLSAGATRLKKGRVLGPRDLAALAEAGIATVTVARLDPGDLGENEAAAILAHALAPEPEALGLAVSAPFTGRVNLFAAAPGVVRIDAAAVAAFNAVDPAITLATLPDYARAGTRAMVATIKIIPYGVARDRVAAAAPAAPPIRLHPFRAGRASIILTRTPGMKPRLLDKGADALLARLAGLGHTADPPVVVEHETGAVARAVAAARGDPVLILTASATSDPADTGPAGLVAAGGRLLRFGMPVDPGNLLFLGEIGGRAVVGLPGSVRSPALSGADWVLERLAAGLAVTPEDIAAMGTGGLLKEIPTRPQPRAGAGATAPQARPRVAAILLAAGAGRRMAGRDKLLEPVGGRPALAAAAAAARASQADRVVAILPPGGAARADALAGLGVEVVEAQAAAEGMAASLRAGLAAVADDADAVVVMLADMPEVGPVHIDRLIAAFDPVAGREICRAIDAAGRPGHPVLFGRRFFESLAALEGDRGARDILRQAGDHLVDVATPGRGATLDLDTPEAWAAWRAEAPARADHLRRPPEPTA
jgi:molybdenum cofactor cytidylyltransferase